MKNLLKLILASFISGFLIASCNKKSDLPSTYYNNGKAVVLSSNTVTLTPTSKDSSTTLLTLNWTNPHYATDSAHQKFVVQIDTSASFTHPNSTVMNGPLTQSYTGNQLNTILASFGIAPGKATSFNLRIVSSYTNNNEQYNSNVLAVSITPYLVPMTLTASPSGAITLSLPNASSTALSFNWNASPYGNDTINYALQMDTVGGNFAKPQVVQAGSNLSNSFTNNDLNSLVIAAGVLGGSSKNMEFRIVSYKGTSYTQILGMSNVVVIPITTYVPIPANLYIVGDATPGGWSNPVPTPSQQFTKIDAYSYGIILNLTAGGSYLLLPVNGSWDQKYAVADNTIPGLGSGGSFGYYSNTNQSKYNSNIPAPATSGLYKIIVNFQTSTYTVTPITSNPIPANLYIVGDATPGGWANPVPTPSQQFTQVSNGHYQLKLSLTAGGSYLLLPVNGDWGHKYGGTSATGGVLLKDNNVPGSNTPAPATSGNYLIDVNFLANTYALTKQ